MTNAHIDLVNRLYPALASGDKTALAEILSPDLVGITTAGLPVGLGGRYEGSTAMLRNFYGNIARHYKAQANAEEIVNLPDGRVLATGRYSGHGLNGGAELDARFVHIFTFSDGRIVQLEQMTDSGRWRDALPVTDN